MVEGRNGKNGTSREKEENDCYGVLYRFSATLQPRSTAKVEEKGLSYILIIFLLGISALRWPPTDDRVSGKKAEFTHSLREARLARHVGKGGRKGEVKMLPVDFTRPSCLCFWVIPQRFSSLFFSSSLVYTLPYVILAPPELLFSIFFIINKTCS
jgi:hypothetical protein